MCRTEAKELELLADTIITNWKPKISADVFAPDYLTNLQHMKYNQAYEY